MDIGLGISVVELLTRLVAAGVPGSIPCPAICFHCIYLLIPPFLLYIKSTCKFGVLFLKEFLSLFEIVSVENSKNLNMMENLILEKNITAILGHS